MRPHKWTDARLREESRKYQSLKDWYTQAPASYRAAFRRGSEFYNEITRHLERLEVGRPPVKSGNAAWGGLQDW